MEILEVDTDTPERKILMLKECLVGTLNKPRQRPIRTKFAEGVNKIIDIIKSCENLEECVEKVIVSLEKTYKREYDKYRVIEYLWKVANMGKKLEFKEGSLKNNIRLLIVHIKDKGMPKLQQKILPSKVR
jgi:hypothetical protein